MNDEPVFIQNFLEPWSVCVDPVYFGNHLTVRRQTCHIVERLLEGARKLGKQTTYGRDLNWVELFG
jgi:hypothetical protein